MAENDKPIALSLFSGAGGMDVGVVAAGFRLLGCVELDLHCCETLQANHRTLGEPTLVSADIREVDPYDLMDELEIKSGSLDLLCGGPPCQAFSQIGKQAGLTDARGSLLFEMVRFAKAFQPRAIIIEQVKGLLTARDLHGRKGGIFKDLLQELRVAGYSCSWQVMNAADYGVAQLRQRLFIVALRDMTRFDFPEATHYPFDEQTALLPSQMHKTLSDAIGHLKSPAARNGAIPPDSHVDVTPAGDRARIFGVPEGEWLSAQLHLPESQRGRLSKKDTTKFRRLDRQRPSLTLRCGEIFFHPTVDRYLTPREYLLIHGYPKSYRLRGPVRGRSGQVRDLDQHRQVANSVPPPLAKAVAERVRVALEWDHSSKSLATP